MDLGLADRVAIVTGAGRGLGRAAAEALVSEGALVLGAARTSAELDELRAMAPDAVETVVCDMLDLEAVADLPRQAVERFGRLDVVVNNAGLAPAGDFLEQGPDLWQRVFGINVFAPAALCRAAGEYLIPQGSGKVVNIASTSGVIGKARLVAYSSSKGAIIQQTTALAAEWARHGIQVNAIAPGAFATEAQAQVIEDADLFARRVRKIPARRMGDPTELGPLVCLLASRHTDFVTASIFVADGGEANTA
jgi:2-deoxy-D-gluconate 3-dehydrogenase